MQLSLAQLDTFELALGEETGEAAQPECQRLGTFGEVDVDIRRDRQLGGGLGDIGRRQQVLVEPLIVAGPLNL
jgi:hypothetical protein